MEYVCSSLYSSHLRRVFGMKKGGGGGELLISFTLSVLIVS